jgi:hypothetical protein
MTRNASDVGREGVEAVDRQTVEAILQALLPPGPNVPRPAYRPYVTQQAAEMEFEDLRRLCAFLRCDISRLVTRIMEWQYARARFATKKGVQP